MFWGVNLNLRVKTVLKNLKLRSSCRGVGEGNGGKYKYGKRNICISIIIHDPQNVNDLTANEYEGLHTLTSKLTLVRYFKLLIVYLSELVTVVLL